MEEQIVTTINGTLRTSFLDSSVSPVLCNSEIFDGCAMTSDNKTVSISRTVIVTEITPVTHVAEIMPLTEINSMTEIASVTPVTEMNPLTGMTPVTQLTPVTEITPMTETTPVKVRASNNQLQLTNEKPEGSSASINQATFVNNCSYVTLVVTIILVIGMMLVPLILYFTSLPSEDAVLSNFNLLDYKNCLVSYYYTPSYMYSYNV